MGKHLIIDADILIFKAASNAETPVEWDDGFWTLHGYENQALAEVMDRLFEYKTAFDTRKITLCLTATTNWRKDVLDTYKLSRKAVRKPMLLPVLRSWMLKAFDAVTMPSLEADDVCGIMATDPSAKEDRIIVSEDKDLKTIPGLLYNPNHDTLEEIDELQADYWHMTQTLVGDATDGYAGCPSIGPVTAEKILKDATSLSEMWERVVRTYEKKNLSEEAALTQARVARILRHQDYKEGKPILWTPPTT